MELNGNLLAIVVVLLLIASPIAVVALLLRWLKVFIPATMERSRRRTRRESGAPPIRRRSSDAVPETWDDSDTTDLHELVELERERQRRRPGVRAPRPGTHHDR